MAFENFNKVYSTGKKDPAGEKQSSTTKFSNFTKTYGGGTVPKTPKQVSVEKQITPTTSQVVTPNPVSQVTPPVKKESILFKVAKTLFSPFFIQEYFTKPLTDEVDYQVKKALNTEQGKAIANTIADSTTGTALVLATPSAFMKASRDILTGGGDGKDIIDYYAESIQKGKERSQNPDNSFGKNLVLGVFDSGIQSLVGVATSLIPYVGKPASVAYWTSISASSQIQDKGEVKSLGNIGIDVAGDMLLGNLVEGILKKPVTMLTKAGFRTLTNIGKGFLAEGITESAQSLLKYANDYRNAKTPEERKEVIEEAKQYVKGGGILLEFLIGGISGGIISGGASIGANAKNTNMPKPTTGITQDRDKYASKEQIQYRKAFREDVKKHLSETNQNIEETAERVSSETGIEIGLATQMVTEIAKSAVTFSDTKFEMTASELRNEIEKTQDLNYKSELQLELNNFYEMGAITELSTPDATIRTFEYDDGKYAVNIVANTPDGGINIPFENSKLYNSQKMAVADAKKQIEMVDSSLLEEPKPIKKEKDEEFSTMDKAHALLGHYGEKPDGTPVDIQAIVDSIPEAVKKEFYKEYPLNSKKTGITMGEVKQKLQEIIDKKTTQTEKVKAVVKEKAKSIREIAKETKIKEPNVRRILGVGAKEGVFERVEQGVYVLSKNGEDLAYIETGNAVESLPRLVKEGFKADMVFLDIPYDTPAVKGGNRGANYDLLSVSDFNIVLENVAKIVREKNSPVIHMFSNAESGLKAMQKYNDSFEKHGFKVVGKGFYQKTYKDGSPVAFPTIHGSKVTPPEGILVFTLSGNLNKNLENMNFTVVRPKGYQTEKSAEMLEKLIKMTTEEGDMVFDPFAGSGVTGAEAVKAGRKSYNIEKNPEVVEKYTKPRIKEAVEKSIVYRGTRNGGELKQSDETDYGDGYYFADRKETAKEYGKKVQEYTVTLKNPLVIKDRYEMNGIVDKFLALKAQGKTKFERTNDYLKSLGYDGIIVKNGGLGGEDVGGFKIVFDKSSIIENKGKKVLPSSKKVEPTEVREFTEEEVMIPEKKRYYISVLENGKYRWQVVKAEPVSVDPSITTFVFRDGKDYVVSELTTGQRLNTGRTVEEAISESKKSIKKQNEYAKDFAQLLKEAREKFGMEQPYSTYFKDKQEISSKTTKILQTTRATQGLSLAPSTQKTAKGMELELESIFGKDANKIPNAKMSKGFVTPTPLVKKSDIKEIIKNSPEFKKDPVLIVDADKNLTFTSPRTSFKIKADALNLYKDGLQEGDKITVDIASLKETGTQQMRVFKDGQPMYQRRKEDTERFLSQPEVRAELAKYFDDGELAITFADRITMEDGGEAWGKYEKGMVEFVNNPLAETPTHEAVHAFLDIFTSPEQKSRFIAEALKQQANKIGIAELNKQVKELHAQYGGKYSRERIKQMYGEELLADGFVEHRRRRNAKGILRTWYDKIIAFLRRIFKRNSAQKLYDDIVSKRRDFIKKDFENQRQIIKYQDISVAEQAKNALAVIKKQRQLTSKFFESPNIKGKEVTSYTYLRDLSKSTGLGLKGVETKIIQEVLETPQFKDKKVININDFKREVIGNMLPLSVIKTDTYAEYGSDNIGRYNDNKNTYLFNSEFEHGVTGHFPSDFGRELKRDDIEIKEIPPQQGNPTSKFAVIKKGVTLTEENVEQNVFNVANTKAEAEKWVDLHVVNDSYKGTANETVEVNKRGLFGHARTFDDFQATDNGISHVAEIQSDVFQHLERVPTSDKEIVAKKKDIEIINTRIESLNKRLEDAKNSEFIEGNVRDSLAYKARVKEIKDEIARQEQNKKEIEEKLKTMKPLPPMPYEERFLEYKNIWHERIVRELIHMKANEGFDYMRFPTPRTVAVIEGYQGGSDSDNIMPYELTGGQTREDTLTFGDEINYGGEQMTVLSDDSYEIIVAPTDAVRHFDYDDYVTEDIESIWGDQIEWEFGVNGGLYKDFGEITTAEKAQEVIDQIAIYNEQVKYNTIAITIKTLKERDSFSSSRKYSLDRIESTKEMIADLERERNALTLDLIKKSGIMDSLKQTNGGFSLSALTDKFGQSNTFWRSIIDSYNGMDNPTPKKIFDDVKKGLEEQIKDRETTLAEYEKSIIEADERLKKDIEEEKARKPVPANKLKLLPKTLQEKVKTADWEYRLDYNVEKILEKMAEKDPEETFEIGDFRYDVVQEMAESYDPDFEGIYGKDHIFIQEKGYGNQEVWVVDEGSYTETFSQPEQYDEVKTAENFTLDDFDGNELTVLKFYDQQVNKYLAKLRKDNLELVTDDNGYEWLETKLTDQDKEAPTAYMPKKSEEQIISEMKPIELPELITLARNLTGQTPKVKVKMGKMLGYFRGVRGGEIAIKADLFNKGNELQVAKTLAHEIGHLADWLPDQVSGRGNLLGRIFSLRKFMSSTFDKGLGGALKLDEFRSKALKQILAEDGIKYGDYLTTKSIRESLKDKINARYKILVAETGAIRNPEINKELTAVTEYWRPYDKAKVSESHRKYRNSSSEKYADAISMLFNAPEMLQEMAPTFYTEFFNALDRKPEFKAQYFELQELLNGTNEDLMKKRKESIIKGFIKAEELQADYRRARKAISDGNFWEVARKMIEDENWSAIKIQSKSQKNGKTIADEDNIKYATQEDKFADNDNYLLLYDIKNQIDIPMAEAGLTKEDLGEYMLLKRIVGQVTKEEMPEIVKDMERFYEINENRVGDRAILANPHGFNLRTALSQLEFLEQTLGEENFALLEEKTRLFHDLIFKSVERAVEVGAYNKKVFEEKILPNKYNYAYYQVVKHLEEFVSGRIETQKGTFEEVANPYVATILKTVSLNYLNSKQNVKNAVIKELKENYPEDISETEVKDVVAGRKIYGSPKGGRETITVLEDGKQVSYDVDPLIAEMFQKNQYRNMATLIKMISIPNNKFFKPLFTTFNPAFVLWNNPWRDQKALFKALPPAKGKVLTWDTFITGFAKVVWTTLKTIPEASRYTRGKFSPLVRDLIESKAIVHPIQGYTYDPDMSGELVEMFKQFAIVKDTTGLDTTTAKYKILKPIRAVADFFSYISQTADIATKISGSKLRMKAGESGKLLAHNVRNYTGTPNWKVRGGATFVTNEISIFSNVMIQGLKSSYELATQPRTRLGYWLKTIQINFIPALLLYALSKGLLMGDDDWGEEFMGSVSSYDKENYDIVPLGWYYPETDVFTRDMKAEKSPTRKAVYARIPPDEQGRILRAMLWKGLDAMNEKDPKKLGEMLTVLGGGVLPNLTPALTIPLAWSSAYLLGQNPYDSFRGRNIVDATSWDAGGMDKLKKMTAWTINQSGIVNIATYDKSKNTTTETIFQTTPYISKVIKISNYGQQEKLKQVGQDQQVIDKKALQERTKIVDEYVIKAREEGSTIFTASKYRADLIKDVLGGHLPKTKEEEQIATSVMTQFKLKLKKGLSYDPRVDSLLTFSSKSQKIAILNEIKKEMSPEEWIEYRKGLVKDQIISPELSFSVK